MITVTKILYVTNGKGEINNENLKNLDYEYWML